MREGPVFDAWMQYPDQRWISDDMFAPLRRWEPGPFCETAPPVGTTAEAGSA